MNITDYIASIYAKQARGLYKYIRTLVDDSSAEDLLQETFERFIIAVSNKKIIIGMESNWLYRVAHNVSVDYLRKNHRLLFDEELLANIQAPGNLAVDFMDKSFQNKIKKIFNQLALKMDKEGKYLILLNLLQSDAAQKEIGAALGVTERTVRTMTKKLFLFIEAELKKMGIDREFAGL
jgi:RNA polymerase sigma-70 factor (ECF subfamily)